MRLHEENEKLFDRLTEKASLGGSQAQQVLIQFLQSGACLFIAIFRGQLVALFLFPYPVPWLQTIRKVPLCCLGIVSLIGTISSSALIGP
ncbi:hypothetical protein Taro_039374 [Colocasia esculenta]|uniref:Uncharacterized protein n=1 Tax=Colocasia esculenta TaxID=4460 RepID=A0A843WVK8_COLES|nr:hypothetical protein [Colocasia esculenta]